MEKINASVIVDISYPDAPNYLSTRLQEKMRSRHRETLNQLLKEVETIDEISNIKVSPLRHLRDWVEFSVEFVVVASSYAEARSIARETVIKAFGNNNINYEIDGIQLTPR